MFFCTNYDFFSIPKLGRLHVNSTQSCSQTEVHLHDTQTRQDNRKYIRMHPTSDICKLSIIYQSQLYPNIHTRQDKNLHNMQVAWKMNDALVAPIFLQINDLLLSRSMEFCSSTEGSEKLGCNSSLNPCFAMISYYNKSRKITRHIQPNHNNWPPSSNKTSGHRFQSRTYCTTAGHNRVIRIKRSKTSLVRNTHR